MSDDLPIVPPLLTSSDTRLSMAPSMECSAPGEAEGEISVVTHDQENRGLRTEAVGPRTSKLEQMGKLRSPAKSLGLLLCTKQ